MTILDIIRITAIFIAIGTIALLWVALILFMSSLIQDYWPIIRHPRIYRDVRKRFRLSRSPTTRSYR